MKALRLRPCRGTRFRQASYTPQSIHSASFSPVTDQPGSCNHLDFWLLNCQSTNSLPPQTLLPTHPLSSVFLLPFLSSSLYILQGFEIQFSYGSPNPFLTVMTGGGLWKQPVVVDNPSQHWPQLSMVLRFCSSDIYIQSQCSEGLNSFDLV